MECGETPAEDRRECFARAAREYGGAMYRSARAVLDSNADAEDAVGEALLKAWQNWDRLRDPTSLRAWLLRITVNCAYTQRRKLGRVTAVEDVEPLAGSAVDRPYEDLWEAVCSLPPDHRVAVTLFYYEDMTVEQIARTLGLPKGTVKSRLNRARKRLRELLGEGEETGALTRE